MSRLKTLCDHQIVVLFHLSSILDALTLLPLFVCLYILFSLLRSIVNAVPPLDLTGVLNILMLHTKGVFST